MFTAFRARLFGLFSRVTSSHRFVPEIDGLRFWAIFSVFVFHLDGYLTRLHPEPRDAASRLVQRLTAEMHFGVQLFFLISGFILALPFASHHRCGGPAVSLRSYFARRVTRLEPPYLLTLVVLYCLLVAAHRGTAHGLLPHLLASAGYAHNVIYRGPSLINGVAWSLEIEIQFYLLVPLLTRVFAIANSVTRRGLLAASMLALALYQSSMPETSLAAFTIAFFLQYFLAGFLLADIYLVDWRESPSRSTAFDLLGISALAATAFVCVNALHVRFLLPFLLLAIAIACFRGRALGALCRAPAITAIGGMCYSIYLIHYQVISTVMRATRGLAIGPGYFATLLLQIVVVGSAVVAASAVLFLLVEKPCMRRDWPARMRSSLTSLFGARPADASETR
jgi:peptidoglycan/LPS O-acetylase OafA/YrhL